MIKIYEGNCINAAEEIEGKGFLAPDGVTYSDIPQIGWEIVEKRMPEINPIESLLKQAEEVYFAQDLYLQAMFKPVKDSVTEYARKGELSKVLLILNSPHIPADLNDLRQAFLSLFGGA